MNFRSMEPNKEQNQEGEQRKLVSQEISVESFRGPLPPPIILEQYDKIVPGAADRIMKMAEEQSKHRRTLEAKVIGMGSLKSILGTIFAFIVAIIGLLIGGYTALKGQPFFGSAVSISIIAAVVGTFIYGTQQKKGS